MACQSHLQHSFKRKCLKEKHFVSCTWILQTGQILTPVPILIKIFCLTVKTWRSGGPLWILQRRLPHVWLLAPRVFNLTFLGNFYPKAKQYLSKQEYVFTNWRFFEYNRSYLISIIVQNKKFVRRWCFTPIKRVKLNWKVAMRQNCIIYNFV